MDNDSSLDMCDMLVDFYRSALCDAVDIMCGNNDDIAGRLYTLYKVIDFQPELQDKMMATYGKLIASFAVDVITLADAFESHIQ